MSSVKLSQVEVRFGVENGNGAFAGQNGPRPGGEGRGDKRPPRPPQVAAKHFKTALRAVQDQPKTIKIAQIAEIDKA